MNDHLRSRLVADPLVHDFANRIRACGETRSFFETIEGGLCPIYLDTIRRGYPQRGGTIDAPAELIARVVLQLAFDPESTQPQGRVCRCWARLRRRT